ncbi:MAG TPA: hypothetical protein VFP97_00895, partial [Chitinophagaceae bacterium]|nr:hypothetical protein [Chitinophagaceae bacterium]
CVFTLLMIASCREPDIVQSSSVEIKKLNYSSASAVEYYDGKLYIMGDDAPNMIVLDTVFNTIDSATIVLHSGTRIPKDTKPDLEASAIYSGNNETLIFFFGSGSLDPYRNSGWNYNLRAKTKDNVYLQPLYAKIKQAGIEQINIEGAAFVAAKLILVNRGNKGYPYNQLIGIDESFLKNDSSYKVAVIPFEIQKDTASFKGISGLTYAKQSDHLIMTVSTEDTRNAYDDGTIGKSYLWIIDNISAKLVPGTIKPDRIIDLEEIDSRFKSQKIESATVIEETKDFVRLVLVADNDDGSSTIFKMSIDAFN